MQINPLEQFNLKQIIPINIMGYDLSFTNSALISCLTASLAFFLLLYAVHTKANSRISIALEMMFKTIFNMVSSIVGEDIHRYNNRIVKYIFSLFIFIVTVNLSGMIPLSFAATSHISVTFALAAIVFIVTICISVAKHKLKFFTIFVPHGVVWWLVPLIFIIEFFSYLSRPVSLSIRLGANMISGHVMMHVVATFVVMMGLYGFLPFAFLLCLNLFEFFVAILQGYIFALLSSIYISHAIHH